MEQQNEQPTDIAALVKADEQRRVEACAAEIEAALKRHNCTQIAELRIIGRDMMSKVHTVALKT